MTSARDNIEKLFDQAFQNHKELVQSQIEKLSPEHLDLFNEIMFCGGFSNSPWIRKRMNEWLKKFELPDGRKLEAKWTDSVNG